MREVDPQLEAVARDPPWWYLSRERHGRWVVLAVVGVVGAAARDSRVRPLPGSALAHRLAPVPRRHRRRRSPRSTSAPSSPTPTCTSAPPTFSFRSPRRGDRSRSRGASSRCGCSPPSRSRRSSCGISRGTWHSIHLVSYALFFSSTFHALTAGPDTRNQLLHADVRCVDGDDPPPDVRSPCESPRAQTSAGGFAQLELKVFARARDTRANRSDGDTAHHRRFRVGDPHQLGEHERLTACGGKRREEKLEPDAIGKVRLRLRTTRQQRVDRAPPLRATNRVGADPAGNREQPRTHRAATLEAEGAHAARARRFPARDRRLPGRRRDTSRSARRGPGSRARIRRARHGHLRPPPARDRARPPLSAR